MFDRIFCAALKASDQTELEKLLGDDKKHLDIREDKKPFLTPAGKLALNNKNKAVELLSQLGADSRYIIRGYILANNYDEAKKYASHSQDRINEMASICAMVNNHQRVEELRTLHNADVNFIVDGYLCAKNDSKVREYRIVHQAIVNEHPISHHKISSIHASKKRHTPAPTHAGHSKKIEDHRTKPDEHKQGRSSQVKHRAPVPAPTPTLAKYLKKAKKHRTKPDEHKQESISNENLQPFDRAMLILRNFQREDSEKISKILLRLKRGQENHWNPYWMNSGTKLNRIIEVLERSSNNLANTLNDGESPLYQAINIPRIPIAITLFGALDSKRTRSLKMMQKESNLKSKERYLPK